MLCRTSVKKGPSHFTDADKQLTTVKELSNSSENEAHDHHALDKDSRQMTRNVSKGSAKPENLILDTNTEIIQVLTEDAQVDIINENEIKFSKCSRFPTKAYEKEQGGNNSTENENYPKENVHENYEIKGEPQSKPENLQVAQNEEENESDEEDNFDDERKVILEVGSPHPIKSCYASLEVSQEQLEILDKALKSSKKLKKNERNWETKT